MPTVPERRVCRIAGCTNPTPGPASQWCRTHKARHYRYGDVNWVPRSERRSAECEVRGCHAEAAKGWPQCAEHINRRPTYRRRRAPAHPLASDSGWVLVHRAELYDVIGPGWHRCRWCHKLVSWDFLPPHPQGLAVDHLDWDRTNNDIGNLAPSCHGCNAARQKRYETIVRRR